MASIVADGHESVDPKRDRLVIVASTLGTVFEWYDFFVYGTLASLLAGKFFPSDNPAVSFLIFLASFGVGFGMRPLGGCCSAIWATGSGANTPSSSPSP